MALELQVVLDDIFPYDSIQDETILREDMYQATCQSYGIDCGWYHRDENPCFITYLIKDFNWEIPLVRIETYNLNDAKWSIGVCKDYLAQL